MTRDFYAPPLEYCHLNTAKAAIVSIPYESSVSYGGGTRNGPHAILTASQQVELYDEVLQSEPFRAGIYSEPIGRESEISKLSPKKMIARYQKVVGRHLDAGRFPVILGGEHTVTLAPFAAAIERFPNLQVLHFDAHADLREQYEDNPFSHACVARRMAERTPIVQLGIRSYDRDQAEAIPHLPVKILHAHEIHNGRDPIKFVSRYLGDPVYLTIDLDAFDPAEVPATGTPEPGGLHWQQVDHILEWLFAHRTVIAMDVVELAPIRGLHAADFLAARLIYRCIGRRFASVLK